MKLPSALASRRVRFALGGTVLVGGVVAIAQLVARPSPIEGAGAQSAQLPSTPPTPLVPVASTLTWTPPAPTASPRRAIATPPYPSENGLTRKQVQRTVADYTPNIKRTCWDERLDERAPNAPNSARIDVTVVIKANGRVESATAQNQAHGYEWLAECVEERVRRWRFPRARRPSRVNIPFVFVAQ